MRLLLSQLYRAWNVHVNLHKHFEAFADALLHAYDINGLVKMLRFDMDIRLDEIVGPGAGANRVFELIEWCERKNREDELFLAALKRNPDNPKLRELAKIIAAEVTSEHQKVQDQLNRDSLNYGDLESSDADAIRDLTREVAGNDGLQALVVASTHMASGQEVDAWELGYGNSKSRICSVGIDGRHQGTGFLIGDDLIMTNSHVLPPGQMDKADVVFDLIGEQERINLPTHDITEELVRSSPRELDFLILRLRDTPGNTRGFYRANPHTFQMRESVLVVGHPGGEPLRMSFGMIFDSNSYVKRIAYSANTQPGSSGSPVFLEDWSLAAIHHHGDAGINNHGIPMSAILRFLNSNGHGGLLQLDE